MLNPTRDTLGIPLRVINYAGWYEFIGINQIVAWVTGIAIVLGGLGGAASGLVDLNSEYCWIELRSCQVIARAEKSASQPIGHVSPLIRNPVPTHN